MSFFFGGDPFGGQGGGGHPGMGGGRSSGPVDNKELYETLGVPQDVDAKTVRALQCFCFQIVSFLFQKRNKTPKVSLNPYLQA